ncbi:iron-siderophore ABC transporter substrate-binding protein [Brevibacillus sp. M2.1A]|uniref:ABC transporter substrate-binding protein n=1 Tax=Brevibacillus sp. M2.1A TaxID=2738980 RepID=UPI00156B6273|nr:iron-siderophore ABC transporter substrate-binding protein [Brevibacillus sp. M2.1A]MCC8434267.1 iron-siderophore ABC transporter substrate-binding protein [Brevibacillus sp. M2.1A]
MRLMKLPVMLVFLSAMLLLAACGNAGSTSQSGSNQAATAQPDAAKPAEEQVRTVKHMMGESTIKGTPKRIVALEWSSAEHLLALGIQPVGIADIPNMKKWVKLPVEIAPEVVDVGSRTSPNLESIMMLKPDLIIGIKRNVEANYDEMSKIAPTIAFDTNPAEGQGSQYDRMIEIFKQIADITGKNAEAEAALKDLDKTYAEAKEKLTKAGADKVPFVLAMGYSSQNAVEFRLSTDNSTAASILIHIGLTNKYKPKKFEQTGMTLADVEALPALQDANFLHIIQNDDNVIENQLKNNPVWNGLTFVKENRVYALGGDLWPYGGTMSAKILANKAVDLLAK